MRTVKRHLLGPILIYFVYLLLIRINSSFFFHFSSAATLKRKKEAAMRKKDKGTNTPNSPSKMSIDRLQAHWTANIDSSDDEIGSDNSASESLQKILQRENRTVFEVAPEFKLLPRDVTVDAPANVKLTCTLMASPTADVTWTKNDTMELKPGDKYNIVYKKHVCVLEILRTHPSDSGTYTVTASNALGSASCCAKVTVRGEYLVDFSPPPPGHDNLLRVLQIQPSSYDQAHPGGVGPSYLIQFIVQSTFCH